MSSLWHLTLLPRSPRPTTFPRFHQFPPVPTPLWRLALKRIKSFSAPEPDDQDNTPMDNDYTPPFTVHVNYGNIEQVNESRPVFAASLSTLAAYLTEPIVVQRIRDLAREPDHFDNTVTPIYNNLRSLLNQWNNILDRDVRISRPLTAPLRPQQASSNTVAPPSTSAPTVTHRPAPPAPTIAPTLSVPRKLKVGGAPAHYTVQTTLPFVPVQPAPPPIPVATRPPPTFAQAVKSNPKNAVLDAAKMLASMMPDAPAATVFDMASRMAPSRPANRAVMKHAPRDASNVITVKPIEGTSVTVSQIPNDKKLLSAFSIMYEEAKLDGRVPEDAPDVLFVRWMNQTLHIQFRASPPDGTENIIESFWRACPGLSSAQPAISKFRFRNGVLYRRVPFSDPANANSSASLADIKSQLLSQPAWEGITIIGNPRVQMTEGSTFGNVFVDFHDSSTSRCMRQVMRQVVYINSTICRAVQAHNFRPAVPRCAICQRWGHSSQICRSPVVRCPICAQAHDERDHDQQAAHAPTKCFNCGEAHRADSPSCSFFQNRRDWEWIQNHQPSSQTQRTIPFIDLRQREKARRNTRVGMGRITS